MLLRCAFENYQSPVFHVNRSRALVVMGHSLWVENLVIHLL